MHKATMSINLRIYIISRVLNSALNKKYKDYKPVSNFNHNGSLYFLQFSAITGKIGIHNIL